MKSQASARTRNTLTRNSKTFIARKHHDNRRFLLSRAKLTQPTTTVTVTNTRAKSDACLSARSPASSAHRTAATVGSARTDGEKSPTPLERRREALPPGVERQERGPSGGNNGSNKKGNKGVRHTCRHVEATRKYNNLPRRTQQRTTFHTHHCLQLNA